MLGASCYELLPCELLDFREQLFRRRIHCTLLPWAPRRDCFSCSISAAIRRSILFAVIVTPTVIPGWILTPIPASDFLITLVWALLYNPEFPAAIFVRVTAVFVLLPIAVIVTLTFLGWLSFRRCRQRHPTSHASGL